MAKTKRKQTKPTRLSEDWWLFHISHLSSGSAYIKNCKICRIASAYNLSGIPNEVTDDSKFYVQAGLTERRDVSLEEYFADKQRSQYARANRTRK